MTNLLGKTALVVGVANDKSIAYGIAKALKSAGAHIVITVQNEKTLRFTQSVADELNGDIFVMDLTKSGEVSDVVSKFYANDRYIDVLVHSVAFAPAKALNGRVTDVTGADFAQTMDISVHSFIQLVQSFEPMLNPGGSILTVSYLGGQRAVPGYGVMGVAKAALESTARYLAVEQGVNGRRVNVLSPGPIATRAASGISGFKAIQDGAEDVAPLGNVTIDDVGQAALGLVLNRGITGQTIYVDGGFSAVA